MSKPNCRPSMNGNPPEHFRKAGRSIHSAAGKLIESVDAALSASEVFNGRNYQHLPTEEGNKARDADLNLIKDAYVAIGKLRDLGLEIYLIGEE